MTGKRTGHPKKERKFGTCRACGERRFFKARQLCETCYVYAKGSGTLHEFPSVYDKKNDRDTPGTFCRCFSPIVDPMPAWNTAQCLKCGREIRK